jgi:hypothetical protein
MGSFLVLLVKGVFSIMFFRIRKVIPKGRSETQEMMNKEICKYVGKLLQANIVIRTNHEDNV